MPCEEAVEGPCGNSVEGLENSSLLLSNLKPLISHNEW